MKIIEDLLRDRIGLDPGVIGSGALERVVRQRIAALGLDCVQELHHRLLSSSKAFADLLEGLLITETWFFRDPEAFSTLARMATDDWLPRHPAGKLRILSLPCSTGEEPYSIVMALLDTGLPPARFRVDAVDISSHSLAHARGGLYGKHAFRGSSLLFQERHFRRVGPDHLLNSSVRRQVFFQPGNLLDPGFTPAQPNYDFIFFRNLLIYLHPEAQQTALQRMTQLLSPSGLVFLGPAEQPIAFNAGYVSAGSPMAFACARPPIRQTYPAGLRTTEQLLEVDPVQKASQLHALTPPHADLRQAKRLADVGRLTEAEAICEAHLRQRKPSAQAYYLLGLVRDARGDSSAIECYRRAVYLEPTHYEALVHLALLTGKNGDQTAALNLQRRAERLQLSQSFNP